MRRRSLPAAGAGLVSLAVVLGTALAATPGTTTDEIPATAALSAAGETSIWLSALAWTDAENGFGPVEKDASNGEDAAGDGNPITLDGEVHRRGLGVAAPSKVTYDLDGQCRRLRATVGIDDEVDDRGIGGSVAFQVVADGEAVLDSGVRYGTQWSDSVLETTAGSLDVDVDVTGVRTLELRTDPWYDGAANDHADWASARVICDESFAPPPYVIVRAEPAEPVLLPGEPTTVVFALRNTSDEAVDVPVTAEAPDGYTASAPPRVELPPDGDVDLEVTLTRTTSSLADAQFRLVVGDQSLTVPLRPSDNWARIATMSASSTFAPSSPDNLNDRISDSAVWSGGGAGGWNDDTSRGFPDTVTATWSHPVELSRVKVYTLDSSAYPAARYGVRDYDVLAQVAGAWRTVAEVRGNQLGVVESTFAAVSADQLQIRVLASNSGDYSRLIEVEAYPR